tara:strand:- start:356 stop:514 length:159 start_codon:yes stop_codon:yes gene_type:complete
MAEVVVADMLMVGAMHLKMDNQVDLVAVNVIVKDQLVLELDRNKLVLLLMLQ